MELLHIQTFVTVADLQSVTRAAERLFLTPPSVSAQIRVLEQELQVALFIRTPRGMQLTEAGRMLRPQAEQILRTARDFLHQAAQLRASLAGRVVLGLNAGAAWLRVAAALTVLQARHPNVELSLASAVSGLILEGLRAETLDAGFIFGAPPDAAITACQLTTAELVVAAPQAWGGALEGAGWQELAQQPWIASTGYCPFQELLDQAFARRGLSYQRVIQAGNDATRVDLVRAGVGLSLLERTEAQQAAQLGDLVICPTESILCPLSLAFLTQRAADPLVQALTAAVREVWMADAECKATLRSGSVGSAVNPPV